MLVAAEPGGVRLRGQWEGGARGGDGAPLARVLMLVAAEPGVVRLVEHGKGELGEVDDLDVEGSVVAGAAGEPLAHGQADAVGAGGGDDDAEVGHALPGSHILAH